MYKQTLRHSSLKAITPSLSTQECRFGQQDGSAGSVCFISSMPRTHSKVEKKELPFDFHKTAFKYTHYPTTINTNNFL